MLLLVDAPRVRCSACQRVRAYACLRTRLLSTSLLQELWDRRQSALFKDKVQPFHQVVVAARKDKRSDARFSGSSDAHSVRRRPASGARSLRLSARSVRRTRDRANLMQGG
jgi:hypothetical protein